MQAAQTVFNQETFQLLVQLRGPPVRLPEPGLQRLGGQEVQRQRSHGGKRRRGPTDQLLSKRYHSKF